MKHLGKLLYRKISLLAPACIFLKGGHINIHLMSHALPK